MVRKKIVNFYRSKHEMLSLAAKKHVMSEETKLKISNSLRCYLVKHPDKIPYKLNHKSKGESYPEKYFRKWLESENINFIQEYSFELYSFDFLINNLIDLEIDGAQHKVDKRIKASDERRDTKAKAAGFIVYRINWSDFCKLENKKEFLEKLKNYFNDIKNEYPEIKIEKKKPEKRCVVCNKILTGHQEKYCTVQCQARKKHLISKENNKKRVSEAIELLESGMSFLAVGKAFNVSDNAIRKWLRQYNIDPKKYTKYKVK